MGAAVDKLVKLATMTSGVNDPAHTSNSPGQGGRPRVSSAIPFDVNDVIAYVHNLSDEDVKKLDDAVDAVLASRGIANSE